MQIETIILNASVTIFSLGLLLISLLSYRRHKNQKLLFVCCVFVVFFFKGILFTIDLFSEGMFGLNVHPLLIVLDLLILILLFIATLKK